MDLALIANKKTYAGLFLVALSVMMYEILLTRIFSVIASYHFAFIAISIAMFGMTLGAILVYLLPRYQKTEKTQQQLATSALLFSVTIVGTLLILLTIPLKFIPTIEGILTTSFVFVVIALPFICSGICVCLALTKFTPQVNKLYAADLFGAGIGCISAVLILNTVSAPTATIIAALFASLAAVFFSRNAASASLSLMAVSLACGLMLITGLNQSLENKNNPLFRFSWIKNSQENPPLYEKWNIFSRITIDGNLNALTQPFGWGLSALTPKNKIARYGWLRIDANALTPLTYYDHDIKKLSYLKYDVTNIGHYFHPHAKVLIIGIGGGRDILSALAFQQKSILGIEINPTILQVLREKFSAYTGHLNQDSRVTLVNDEARSFITRLPEQFDLIQMSLIDTWAATASGAYALSENGLYTTEAWRLFLNHLTSQGIFSISRWYLASKPTEMQRLIYLAVQSLNEIGASNPQQHLMVFAAAPSVFRHQGEPVSTATLLVSRQAFTKADQKLAVQLAKKFHFSLLLAPGVKSEPLLLQPFQKQTEPSLTKDGVLDFSPPTDDRPFFFQLIKLSSFFNGKVWSQLNYYSFTQGIFAIIVLLFTVTLLMILGILLPLLLAAEKTQLTGRAFFLLGYFASIGLGFMFIEISQIQRLSLFLGHPTYGLSVVLFALLLSTGMGSLLINNQSPFSYQPLLSFIGVLVMLSIFGLLSPKLISHFQASSTFLRLSIAVMLLFPIGFFMGIALPLGMKLAACYTKTLTPWLWGVNGAASIVGSVLATIIALASGITFSFWTGVGCYFTALVLLSCLSALTFWRA